MASSPTVPIAAEEKSPLSVQLRRAVAVHVESPEGKSLSVGACGKS